jgi:hypothetical protein
MCYQIRQFEREPEPGRTTPSSSFHFPSPRWGGAIAATLVAGLAVAALVAPSQAPRLVDKHEAAAVPVASRFTAAQESMRSAAEPPAALAGKGITLVDDGVPTEFETVKAGNCQHGM